MDNLCDACKWYLKKVYFYNQFKKKNEQGYRVAWDFCDKKKNISLLKEHENSIVNIDKSMGLKWRDFIHPKKHIPKCCVFKFEREILNDHV